MTSANDNGARVEPCDEPAALQRIRIVLVRPQHPGNIGAAARAMKTMGLTQLWLVRPRRFPDPQAVALAAEAADVLAAARMVDRLQDAIGDCGMAIGTSGRERGQQWPLLGPGEAAQRVWQCAASADAALVFGPERSGLASADLYLCQYRSAIATSTACRSLNLSHAVQVYGYAIRAVANLDPPRETPAVATGEDRERLYEHLHRVLVALDFPRRNPDHLLLKFQALGNRADLGAREVSMLRGLLRRVEEKIASGEDNS